MSGGAMKTAGKAAALCGYRLVGPLAGRASAIARWPFKPVNVTVSAAAPAAEGGPSISVSTSDNGLQDAVPVSAVQRQPLETHDWETKDENFDGWAEYEQGITLDPVQPAPRLVFGSIPTLEEAKEATSDLIDAFEKVYPPSHNVPAIEVAHKSAHHEASSIIPSMPRHVVETFSLLQRSPEVQIPWELQSISVILCADCGCFNRFGRECLERCDEERKSDGILQNSPVSCSS